MRVDGAMTALYTRLYGGMLHSGFLDVRSQAKGKLCWIERIAAEGGQHAETRVLLGNGSRIVASGMGMFVVFSRDGRCLWRRPKWKGSSIFLEDGWIFYVSPDERNILQAVDLDNRMQLAGVPILGLIGTAVPEILEPSRGELVVQIYDSGNPEEASANTLIYRMRFEGAGFEWSRRYPGGVSKIQGLVCLEQRRLVTSIGNVVLIFDLDGTGGELEPLCQFSYPIDSGGLWLSGGADGALYWAGFDGKGLDTAATDLEGRVLWRWQLGSANALRGTPVAPPIVAQETMYVLTSSVLCAVRGGTQRWFYETGTGGFKYATALADGSVVITSAAGLHRVDAAGSEVFGVEFEEPLVTPPLADDQGRIYVASKEALYAFD